MIAFVSFLVFVLFADDLELPFSRFESFCATSKGIRTLRDSRLPTYSGLCHYDAPDSVDNDDAYLHVVTQ